MQMKANASCLLLCGFTLAFSLSGQVAVSNNIAAVAPSQGSTLGQSAPPQTAEGLRLPSIPRFVQRCHKLAERKLDYLFGSNDPKNGGLDCSGAIQWILLQEGLASVPRVSIEQYHWLERAGLLHQLYDWSSPASVFRRLRPGDLLFWEDTFDARRNPNITHVMVYLGYDDTKKMHLMFGAKSSKKGENGASVDIFQFNWPHKEKKGRFVAYGRIPSLAR